MVKDKCHSRAGGNLFIKEIDSGSSFHFVRNDNYIILAFFSRALTIVLVRIQVSQIHLLFESYDLLQ